MGNLEEETETIAKTPEQFRVRRPLSKWTNYWNGWQTRWFVFADGVLSYYTTRESVAEGSCKGSIHVPDAELSAHPSDPYRLDVIIPGDQHWYLKASTPQSRQQWLQMLASAKHCLNSSRSEISKSLVKNDRLRQKQCELRLYCDLLIQQVHSVKQITSESPIPDVVKLDESTALLVETCDTLIKTLEECTNEQLLVSSTGCTNENGVLPEVVPVRQRRSSSRGSTSASSGDGGIGGGGESSTSSSQQTRRETPPPNRNQETEQPQRHFDTFFNTMPNSFATLMLDADGSVPTVAFLSACDDLTGIFDFLGGGAFAPIKMDFNGNIRKLRQKFDSDPQRFDSLQRIVSSEIDRNTTRAPNSATDALLWLKRGISFLRELMSTFEGGESDLTVCTTRAYNHTLKKHHSWVVRGIFTIALNALPSTDTFRKALLIGSEADKEHACGLVFERQLRREITYYVAGIDRSLKAINTLYRKNGLELEED